MFEFVKEMFFVLLTFFSSLSNVNSLECVSMNNQVCRIRPKIDINNNEPVFYPFSIIVNKCSGSCNNINHPYAKICLPDTVKNINVKVLNMMSWTNQTKHIEWHENCKCKCRLDSSVCERWKKDKCRCECKELVDKKICDKGSAFNRSNCNCDCNKSCDTAEYLDYKNCKCRPKIPALTEECSKNIDENEMIHNETLDLIPLGAYRKVCSSCTPYIVLFGVFLAISIVISGVFVYFYCYSKKKD